MHDDAHVRVRVRARSAIAVCLLGTLAATASAQQETRAPRRLVAFFWHDSPNDLAALEGIRPALTAAGLPHELVLLHAGSDRRRGIELLASVGAANCDLLFAMGTQAALLAREHLRDVPIVYAAVTNPVVSGVVPSWQGSGALIAGSSNWVPPETILHVFRLAVPGLTRLGILRSRTSGLVSAAELAAMREHLAAAGAPRIEMVEVVADDVAAIATATQHLLAERVQAIWVPIDYTIYTNMAPARAAVAGTGIPLLSSSLQGAREGAVAGVVVDYRMHGQQAAAIALDVLAGTRAIGTIPVMTMQSYQVVVSIDAARQTGHELPLPLLVIADELLDAGAATESGHGR